MRTILHNNDKGVLLKVNFFWSFEVFGCRMLFSGSIVLRRFHFGEGEARALGPQTKCAAKHPVHYGARNAGHAQRQHETVADSVGSCINRRWLKSYHLPQEKFPLDVALGGFNRPSSCSLIATLPSIVVYIIHLAKACKSFISVWARKAEAWTLVVATAVHALF